MHNFYFADVLGTDVNNERTLLALSSMADEKAFTSLFYLYKHKLYSYLTSLTESEMLAEDIVQDVFLKLWNDRETLAEIDNFGSYLFRMSKNQAINHFRRMSRETLIISEMFQANPSDNQTEDTVSLKETKKILEDIIDKLPAQQKMIYKLSRHEGKTHDEIADMLKISPNTIKNHIVQAMSTIRTQLRRYSDTLLMLALVTIFKD
ncbi:RNA polymerase sigma-70 factor [Dyadobacter chenwenxiniae]|uniref:RNA polymerase sigma-70 factor n=1 Tax=Dyadobacter chenwenxiniae TaxID=2906456 RepID=A0A9X1PQU0_9BACT|nr:RNA polymerase sigma-70 factor [Dyadobacter chenwenxiniae]MCF0065745.1 RNA polymerase sigma-70 factor [Dyadobacter chenwenxiniae]UON84117.1 RNA polymerase sigma-70 factor [Dyadobacter chenwenxiniae]